MLQIWIFESRSAQQSSAAQAPLRHLDLIQQIGVAIQHFEQLDQGQGRLGLAVLVAEEGMVAAVAEREQWSEFRRPTPG